MRKATISSFIIIILLSTALFLFLSKNKTVPDGFVHLSGTMTGNDILLSSKLPGKISAVYVSRGDSVKRHQVLFSMENRLNDQKKIILSEINIGKDRLGELKKSIPLAIKGAKSRSSSYLLTYKMLLPLLKDAGKNRTRFDTLRRTGAVSRSEADRIKAKYLSLKLKSKATLNQYKSSLSELASVKAKLINIKIQKNRVTVLRYKLNIIKADLYDSNIRSPINGIITNKMHYTGEVIPAGMPVLSVINPEKLYLKLFISNTQLSKIKIGQSAEVIITGHKPFMGHVSYISDIAEFTPKNVETKKQRIALVYEVHIAVKNRSLILRNGMTADAVIRTDPSKKWSLNLIQ